MFPWKYHDLTPRDRSGELLRLFNDSIADVTAPVGTSINHAFTVPEEKILIFTGWHIEGTPAAVTSLAGVCFVLHNNDTIWRQGFRAAPTTPLAAGETMRVGVHGMALLLPAGAEINLTFFAGGALVGGQSSFYSVSGLLIPRGETSEY